MADDDDPVLTDTQSGRTTVGDLAAYALRLQEGVRLALISTDPTWREVYVPLRALLPEDAMPEGHA